MAATRILTHLILGEGMSLLPSVPCTVQTPVPGAFYAGEASPRSRAGEGQADTALGGCGACACNLVRQA